MISRDLEIMERETSSMVEGGNDCLEPSQLNILPNMVCM